MKLNETVINTSDNTRQIFLLNILIRRDSKVLLIGPSGCGKTNLIKNYLMKKFKLKNAYEINYFNFSAHTSASQTQQIVLSKMIK